MDFVPHSKNEMIKASIDIGTNSVLLLVCEVINGKINPLVEKQEIPRLGKGVDRDKNLHPDSQKRVIEVLKSYKSFLLQRYPTCVDDTIVTATSAVRDASNKKEFINAVKQENGWDVKLLSGDREAEITYRGALSVLELKDVDPVQLAVLDIGGGSTEIAMGSTTELDHYLSIDMGSVRFTERFFHSDPPQKIELEQASEAVDQYLKKVSLPSENIKAIGVAGTVTSIAAISLGLHEYDAGKLNGFELKKSQIEKFINEFSSLETDVIEKKYPVFLKGRGDVILAGILILYRFLERFQLTSITVSTGGIRHGVILSRL